MSIRWVMGAALFAFSMLVIGAAVLNFVTLHAGEADARRVEVLRAERARAEAIGKLALRALLEQGVDLRRRVAGSVEEAIERLEGALEALIEGGCVPLSEGREVALAPVDVPGAQDALLVARTHLDAARGHLSSGASEAGFGPGARRCSCSR